MKDVQFAFVITEGTDLLLKTSWGRNEKEAEKHLYLNSHWSVVKDPAVIENFIKEREKDLLGCDESSPFVRRELANYRNDLELLKKSLKNKEDEQMKDVRKLLSDLEEQKRGLKQKGETGMFYGMELAIDLVKLHVGLGSQLEQDLENFMEEDILWEEDLLSGNTDNEEVV